MAIYSIRNHEIFRCEFRRMNEDPPILIVRDNSKIGYRLVWPLFAPGWSAYGKAVFSIVDPVAEDLPNVTGSNNNDLGERVTNHSTKLTVKSRVCPWHRAILSPEQYPI